jgi:acetylxylan esterase
MKKTFLAAVATAAVATLAAVTLSTAPASAAALQEVTGFGQNPSNIKMFLYVPDNLPANPPILVGVHWCHGTANDFYSGTGYAALADRYGFIVIYPSAVSSDGCWDVHSTASLTHNGGGDSLGIISMVKYVEQRYHADPARVFVTGHSSGGMMTNVLAGAYPDVFRAAAAFAGVPFGCFAGADSWNTTCANGQLTKAPAQWGDQVRAAYPGYTGPRPRMQLWHGTEDDVLRFANFGEEVKQWTNVLGVSQTPTSTEYNVPRSSWTRTRYGSQVEAIQETGQPHNLQILADEAIKFFGLDQATTPTSPSPTSPSPTSPSPTSPSPTAPTNSPPPTGSAPCRISDTVNAWNTGLTAAITVTNTGSAPVNGWRLAFTLPAGQAITSGWNATYSPASGNVSANNAAYNATIAPGASVGIGFQATHPGNAGKPTGFTLNGVACTLV